MRRLALSVPLIAVLALAGCTAPEPDPVSELTAEQCGAFFDSYDTFNDVAQKDGRTDEEMVEARGVMLDAWKTVAKEASEGQQSVIELAIVTFENGIGKGFDSEEYQQFLVARDALRDVCDSEGEL